MYTSCHIQPASLVVAHYMVVDTSNHFYLQYHAGVGQGSARAVIA